MAGPANPAVERTLEVLRLRDGTWTIVTVCSGSDTIRVEPFDAIELALGRLWVESPTSPDLADVFGIEKGRPGGGGDHPLRPAPGAMDPRTQVAPALMRLFRERLLARLVDKHAISEELATAAPGVAHALGPGPGCVVAGAGPPGQLA
jgi:hypothetical protein